MITRLPRLPRAARAVLVPSCSSAVQANASSAAGPSRKPPAVNGWAIVHKRSLSQQQQQQRPGPSTASAASSSRSLSTTSTSTPSSSSSSSSSPPPPLPSSFSVEAHHGAFDSRTHLCGQLSPSLQGQEVVLAGWLDSLRIVSKHLGFLTLRDHTGSVQFVVQVQNQSEVEAQLASISSIPLQSVLLVKGQVHLRPEADRNLSHPSGSIEIHLSSLQVLNPARRDLPFLPTDSVHADRISPEVRAKYRYLDLRRQALGDNIRLRSRIAQSIRSFLYDRGFLEIETPILLRSTPEGAREFLVPTRVSPSSKATPSHPDGRMQEPEPSFYALPQSPQQPKQLLIASGVTDKYFQIAKCFRDEDGRKDRQPEFTQIDLEMGFVSGGPSPSSAALPQTTTAPSAPVGEGAHDPKDAQGSWRIGGEQVREVIEGLVEKVWATAGRGSLDHALHSNDGRRRGFPVLSYWTAMTHYGSDKPDLRYGLRIHDLSSGFRHHDGVAPSSLPYDGQLALEILPHHHDPATGKKLSNKELDTLLAPFRGQVDRFRLASSGNSHELAALFLKKSQNVRSFLASTAQSEAEELAASEVDVNHLAACLSHALDASRQADGIDATDGSVDVFVATRRDPPEGGATLLGDLRKQLATLLASKRLLSLSSEPQFVWITEFPLFTHADEDKNALSALSSPSLQGSDRTTAAAKVRWQSSHHPFTAPMASDAAILASERVDPGRIGTVRGQHYDLVLDGQEIGGGSVRIHDAAMQRRVLETVLELTPEEVGRFQHLLHALSCGAPPHGGIALGFDRLMSILCNASSIRDVIPFPKMGSGVDPVFRSPSPIEAPTPIEAADEQATKTNDLLRMYGLKPLSSS